MKGIEIRETGDPCALELVNRLMPARTEPTDVLVRLAAGGVDSVDNKICRRGVFVPDGLPSVLGCDGAGLLETGGDAVWFCHGGLGGPQGKYTEYALGSESVAQSRSLPSRRLPSRIASLRRGTRRASWC